MRLKGKISAWFYVIMAFVAAVEIPILVINVWIESSLIGALIPLFALVCVESFCLSIVIRNYVAFQKDALLIVFGFIKKSIPYDDIVSISATNELWSSLAASFDRIRIRTKSKGEVLISVVEKEQFWEEIKKRNGNTYYSSE